MSTKRWLWPGEVIGPPPGVRRTQPASVESALDRVLHRLAAIKPKSPRAAREVRAFASEIEQAATAHDYAGLTDDPRKDD